MNDHLPLSQEQIDLLTQEQVQSILIGPTTSQITGLSTSTLTQIYSTSTLQPLQQGVISGTYNTITGTSLFDQTLVSIKTKKYIIAGTEKEYKDFLKRRNFKSDEYEFVNSPLNIRGMRNIHGFYVGTWKLRKDIDEIKLAIELANL